MKHPAVSISISKKQSIQQRIQDGTIDAYAKDWAETEFRMATGKNLFKGQWTLEDHQNEVAAHVAAVKSEMSEPVQSFVISIEFRENKLRDKVKSLGGRWNPDSKTWSVKCKKTELGELETKIAQGNTEYVNLGIGCLVPNNPREIAKAMRMGFDYIES